MHKYGIWVLFALQLYLLVVRSQFGPDPRWLTPDGSKADFSNSFTVGDTVEFSWNALNQSSGDLWITHQDNTHLNYNYSLITGVDLSVPGSYKWTISVNNIVISNSNQFVLRFFPAGAAYGILQFHQLISPGFLLQAKADGAGGGGAQTDSSDTKTKTKTSTSDSSTTSETSSTSTTDSSSSGSTTATQSSATSTGTSSSAVAGVPAATAIPAATSTSSPSSSSGGLSNGAKAGIAVGAVAGVLALLAVGCFLGRRYTVERRSGERGFAAGRHHRMRSASRPSSAAPPYTPPETYALTKTDFAVSEMPAGNVQRPVEVQSMSVTSRPGVHELNP